MQKQILAFVLGIMVAVTLGPFVADGASILRELQGGTGNNSYVTGDVFYAGASNDLDLLSIGSNGQVLKISAGLPAWGTDDTGAGSSLHVDGGGFVYPQTGDYHSAPYYLATSTTQDTNLHDTLYVDSSSGYVGINNSTPLQAIEINQTEDNNAFRINGYDDWSGNWASISITAFGNLNFAGNIDTTTFSTTMRINGAKDINWNTESGYSLGANSGVGSAGGIRLKSGNIDGIGTDGNIFEVYDETDTINFIGNIGVGTSSPMSPLSVVGSTTITDLVSCDTIDTDANGTLSCGTDGGGGSIAQLGQIGDVSTTSLTALDMITYDGTNWIVTSSSTNWNGFYEVPSVQIIAGTEIAWVGNTLNVADSFLRNDGDTGTGAYIFSGASLEIPNATAPTVNASGEIALDTTDDQLLVGDSGNTARVIRLEDKLFSFTLASSSLEFVSGGIIPLPPEKDGFDISQFRCYVDGGTSVVVNVSDGTNDTETITCATTLTSDTDVATNSTFTAGELAEIQIGTVTGTPDYLSFTAYGHWTRE